MWQFYKTIDDLLLSLMTSTNGLKSWIYEVKSLRKDYEKVEAILAKKSSKVAASKSKENTYSPVVQENQLEIIFTNIVSELIKTNKENGGLLIVIDEYDQIENSTGFAKLLKSLATNVPKLKFCIVGVASDIHVLMREHGSIERIFAGSIINLPVMNSDEQTEIIFNAEKAVNSQITFKKKAKELLIKLADGHPYFIHLIGKQALEDAFENNYFEIDKQHIENALVVIAEEELDLVLESRYKTAVTTSYQSVLL